MSYLHAPRLVFSGDFLSDVSTVNNDTAHYNNATFRPEFQKPRDEKDMNGWWNPEGGAVFDFQNCTVTQAFMPDGTTWSSPSQDPVIGQLVMGAEGRPTGKMVDIDPDAQMVSALWCVQIRICNARGDLLLKGDIETTSFRDIQRRQLDSGVSNGQPLGAGWTSVVRNVVWGESAQQSSFLRLLARTTQTNTLAIQLNAFGYYYKHNDGRFAHGRIVGSIGPYFSHEPQTFAPARRLYGIYTEPKTKSVFFGAGNFLVQPEVRRVTLDFGGSIPVLDSIGTVKLSQKLIVAVSKVPQTKGGGKDKNTYYAREDELIPIGEIDLRSDPDWLNRTGGMVSFERLPDHLLAVLRDHQLVLVTPSSQPREYVILARESIGGFLVRADQFVHRLDAGESAEIAFYAYQWGNPLPGARISVVLDDPTPDIPKGDGPDENPISEVYGNNFPASGLTFSNQLLTDARGKAVLLLRGNAIHNPRKYIDGQIYNITYQLLSVDPAFGTEALVVHLRNYFEEIHHPVWRDISEIMIQYGNLYPIMSRYVVDFGDPDELIRKKDILIFAFSRNIDDTMYMPVIRDLSEAKRKTILNWLNNPAKGEREVALKETAAVGEVNPLPAGTALTEAQKRYRDAVKAKNSPVIEIRAIDDLFENL